jgi:predicted RNA-binding Zn ribbon-like protein
VEIRAPYSTAGLVVLASSHHGPEGHFLPSTGAPPGPAHDHLRDPESATAWLRPRREFQVPPGRPSAVELATLRALRGAVQALVAGRVGEYRRRTAALLGRARFRLSRGGRLEPSGRGWTAFAQGMLVPLVELERERARLKRCHNARCRWLFLDVSDNGSRRWCSLTCGNRMKVRAFRARASQRARPSDP